MRLLLICMLFSFQSFAQQDSLNARICKAIQHAKKPVNSPPIYYFPFYNDIQLIEVDYYTYSQREYITRFVKPSKDPLWYSKHVDGEQTNGYILRNSKGKVLKAYGINIDGIYLLPPDEAPIITHKEHLNSVMSLYDDQSFTWKDGNGYGYRFAVITSRERRTEMPEQAYHIFGMLDTLGNVVIPPAQRTIEYFQGEYLAMLDISNTYAIYDSTFNKTYGYCVDAIERIEYNRYVSYGENGGIMNRNGEFMISYPFKSLEKSRFSTDFIYSTIEDRETKFGILSNDLTFKTNPIYRRVGALPTGYGVLTAGSNKLAILNMSGQQITRFEFEPSGDLENSDGTFILLKMSDEGNKYGMIDTLGNTIIPFRYDKIHPFSNDLAIVELNKKMGIVDRTGNVQGEMVYDQIIVIDKEKIQVKIDNRTGYIDRNGVVVDPLKHKGFESLDPKFIHFTGAHESRWIVNSVTNDTMTILHEEHFGKQGFARVTRGGKFGMIDRTGNIVLPIEYDLIDPFRNDLLLVQKNGKYGLLNEKLKVVERLIHRHYRILPNGKYEFYKTQRR
ncbi:WG repeat-containing protein [Fluviicola taffensis]|uniref:WG repeat-containing protein n=1 Tax=Fluviicola taffensis TaxID=191579 RepID=UPI003137DF42